MEGHLAMETSALDLAARLRDLENQAYTVIELGADQANAVAALAAAAPAFFRLPIGEKARSMLGPHAGYRPYGIEYSNSPERPDEMETFSAMAASASLQPKVPIGSARDLHDRTIEAFDLLEPIAEHLVVALAEHLTCHSWSEALRYGLHHWSCLQVNYSRPSSSRSLYINEVHEDRDFLTLAYATSAGLEVRTPSGEFIALTTRPGQMVVMLGAIASLMTDDRLSPLYHRVRSNSTCSERTSVLFFSDLAPELCRPWIVGESNRSIDVGAHVRTSPTRFGLQAYGTE